MLGANGTGSRGVVRPGNGAELTTLQVASPSGAIGGMNSNVGLPDGGRFDGTTSETQVVLSGSEADSESGDDDDTISSVGERRGVKRERAEMEVGGSVGSMVGLSGGFGGIPTGVAGAKPGKKTRGRVKIKMEFIDNKLRRYTTFSKRKTGIMKKAYELSTLTGTQVLLLVASETGHVYTFATRKLQPMITSETGKALIQTCLNSPDSPPRSDPSTDQRMSATGFEETDLTYQVSEAEGCTDPKDLMKPTYTVASVPGGSTSTTTSTAAASAATSSSSSPSSSSAAMQTQNSSPALSSGWSVAGGMNAHTVSSANGTVLKTTGTSTGVMQIPAGFTLMPGGAVSQQLQAIQVHASPQQSTESGPEISQPSSSSTASHQATIVTSSVPSSVTGHMMYPSTHAVMYAASTPTLPDGSLTVLNTFPQPPTAMQVSHTQGQDTGAVPQMFLAGPPGTVQIPVSAVPLHSMLINQQPGGSNTTLTELRVVNLDNAKGD
ncbi:serum response factor a [Chanos chanos]|uniref:Serum response factor n=1 Tax=Chanos chanos TaxID=29144 RepID=A0A6J2V5H1_CHACN|nr:serum response factor-like [Chanos chanos]